MKPCFKCGRKLPIDEFYKHAKMADGHLNKCKRCTKADSAATAAKDPEARRLYVREQMRRRRQSPAHRKKQKARMAIKNELRACRMTKQPCEIGVGCRGRIEAHHDDYDQPLKVRWLCRKHHAKHHRDNPGAHASMLL